MKNFLALGLFVWVVANPIPVFARTYPYEVCVNGKLYYSTFVRQGYFNFNGGTLKWIQGTRKWHPKSSATKLMEAHNCPARVAER